MQQRTWPILLLNMEKFASEITVVSLRVVLITAVFFKRIVTGDNSCVLNWSKDVSLSCIFVISLVCCDAIFALLM